MADHWSTLVNRATSIHTIRSASHASRPLMDEPPSPPPTPQTPPPPPPPSPSHEQVAQSIAHIGAHFLSSPTATPKELTLDGAESTLSSTSADRPLALGEGVLNEPQALIQGAAWPGRPDFSLVSTSQRHQLPETPDTVSPGNKRPSASPLQRARKMRKLSGTSQETAERLEPQPVGEPTPGMGRIEVSQLHSPISLPREQRGDDSGSSGH